MPKSYRAYCADAAVRTAVDHILSSADRKGGLDLPPDMDWSDLPAFHRAVLSAYQVRCERATFLIDLWEAVWRPSPAESGLQGDLEPSSVADTEVWNAAKLDPHTVWENQWFGRNFNVGGGHYSIAVGASDDSVRLKLSLQFCGADDMDNTTGRSFGDDWPEQDIEDGCAWTNNGRAPIRDDGTINHARDRSRDRRAAKPARSLTVPTAGARWARTLSRGAVLFGPEHVDAMPHALRKAHSL